MPGVLLCVSIDCECDKGRGWRTRSPLSFRGVHLGMVQRLQPLFAAYGGKPTYLLSPELLRDAACVEALRSLGGCELGAHLHGELAEPGAFTPEVTREVQREYGEPLERAKVESLTASFRAALGRAPAVFRAGRFGIGAHTIPILERLGYRVESSVTPHVDWRHVSRDLSFRGAPSQPYHPDPGDPARPGSSSLLEVPVTILPGRLAGFPLLGRLARPRWLRPTWAAAGELPSIARTAARHALAAEPAGPVVLNAMFHNVEVIAGASPYARTDDDARRILRRVGELLSWARAGGVPCVGLGDVPAELAGKPRHDGAGGA